MRESLSFIAILFIAFNAVGVLAIACFPYNFGLEAVFVPEFGFPANISRPVFKS